MSVKRQTYSPAQDITPSDIPEAVLAFFNGKDLLSKTQAVRISTTDADGWPRASLLTAGEILFLPDRSARFAVFRESGTANNLKRDGRLMMSMAQDRGILEIRLRAVLCRDQNSEAPLDYFAAEILGARLHVADYADVTSGVTFAVYDASAVLPRWEQQIAALRARA